MMMRYAGVLLSGRMSTTRLASYGGLQNVRFSSSKRRPKKMKMMVKTKTSPPSAVSDAVEVTGNDDGSMRVGDIDLCPETVEHFVHSVGASNPADINAFRDLAEKHLGHIDFDDESEQHFDPNAHESIKGFQQSLEKHVERVANDSVEEMAQELVKLYDDDMDEFKRSSNPDFGEFPARDILADVVDDDDVINAVEARFKGILKARSLELKKQTDDPESLS